jgi:hypothetical protein
MLYREFNACSGVDRCIDGATQITMVKSTVATLQYDTRVGVAIGDWRLAIGDVQSVLYFLFLIVVNRLKS